MLTVPDDAKQHIYTCQNFFGCVADLSALFFQFGFSEFVVDFLIE